MKYLTIIMLWAITITLGMSSPAPAQKASTVAKVYVCPDCGCESDNVAFDKPGSCPSCGMALIEKGSQKKPVSAAILLFDGAEVIDFAGPWEVFGEAGFKVHTVAERNEPVKAVFGQRILADYTFENSPPADIILVPGGSIDKAIADPHLIKWLQSNAKDAKHVMSVCNGAFILARAGLLDGLTATTISHAIDQLAQVAPKTKVVYDKRFVDNGKIITTAGLSSGIDGAFHLIAKIKGKGTAQATALGMEYRWEPESKFARAALADRYFPEINDVDGEIVSTEGDLDRWEVKALFSKPNSTPEIIKLISNRIVSKTPHARGAISLMPVNPSQPGVGSEISWRFTDEDGRDWKGSGLVEPAVDQPGKFMVTLKLARAEDKQT